MKWLVQEFLNNGSNITRVIQALEYDGVEYFLVTVNKDNTLTVIDNETKLPYDDSDERLERFILNESIMVYGSKTFAQIANRMNLKPGSFMNEQFEFEIIRKVLGNELLNYEFVVGELQELQPIADTFFIRPTGNTKLFTGMTVTKEDFLLWQEREKRKDSPYIGESLMISKVQNIKSEYRFFVVNQQIITGSSYKVGQRLDVSHKPSKEMLDYTQKIIEKFPIAKAFVVDIAETDKGLKVVEYNNINTSGLYGCDERAFVQAIQNLNIE